MANNKIDTGVDKIGLADGEVRPYKDYYDDHDDDDDDDDGDDDDDDDDKIGLADGEVRGFQIQKIFLLHFLIWGKTLHLRFLFCRLRIREASCQPLSPYHSI